MRVQEWVVDGHMDRSFGHAVRAGRSGCKAAARDRCETLSYCTVRKWYASADNHNDDG